MIPVLKLYCWVAATAVKLLLLLLFLITSNHPELLQINTVIICINAQSCTAYWRPATAALH